MSFEFWGRFLILAAGGMLAIVCVVVIACFVGPGCWGFEYLHKVSEEKKKKNSFPSIEQNVAKNTNCQPKYFWLENRDDFTYERGPFAFETKVSKLNETALHCSRERVFSLKCAPLLVSSNLYSAAKTSIPKLEIKIFYSILDSEEVSGRLTVQIISAAFLPCREYITTLDPSVALEVLNNKWSLQKNQRIVHTIQTEVVKNSLNPIFNETFVFDAKKIEIKNWSLKFTILDNDRLTKVTPLFERRLYLKEVKSLTLCKPISFSLEMQDVRRNVGALFFGISYMPTAQRLNINVIKAGKLRYQTFFRSLVDFNPYVRVVMVNNHGKCVKRKKTCVKHADENPIFNQCLIFDLSISNLEQTVFLMLLCAKSAYHFTNSDDSSPEGDIETSLQESKDKVLGAIVLGRNVRCTRARDHWVAVMQNPRKMISVWHDLK